MLSLTFDMRRKSKTKRLNHNTVPFNLNKILVAFFFLFLGKTVSAQLNADFTASILEGCGSISGTQFTPTGDASITSWSWSFGNNNSSTLQNPSASFTAPGRYTVTLTVSNGTTSQTVTKNNYIVVYRNPTANFNFTPTGGCSPLNVTFTSTSTLGDAPINNYIWDFKDGSQAPNTAAVNHSYQVQGSFSPSLQITDTNGCSSTISLGPINVTPSPIASFSTNSIRATCDSTLTINFINGSSGSNLTYLWDFGDANTSTQINPTHTYNGFGNYTVSLTVSDPSCTNTRTETNYIRLTQPLANFSLPKDIYCVGEPILFINNSTDISTYLWDFGDGSGSVSRLPNKSFADSGTFVITLTGFGPGCTDSFSDTITIEKVIADFVVDTFTCNREDSIQFIDQSYNAVEWSWRLGRINFSNDDEFFVKDSSQNPFLTYLDAGRFSDSLIVTSANGCKDTLFKKDHRVFEPTSVLITDDNGNIYLRNYSGCYPDTIELNSLLSGSNQAGSYTYTWTLPDSQTYIGPNPPQGLIITNDSAQKVTLNVVSSAGCKASNSMNINLGYKIAPVVNYFPTNVCSADSFFVVNINPNDSVPNFIAYLIENVNNTYKDSIVPNGLTDTAAFSSFQDTGYYNLTIRQGYNGCDSVETIDSAFYVGGPIIKSTDFSSDCIDRNLVNFKAFIINGTRFSWDFGDSSVFDTTNLITNHRYDSLVNQQYIFTAYNDSSGCPPVSDTQTISLPVISLPIIRPDDPNVCLGEDVLIWQNSLTRLDSLVWTIDGQPVSQSDSFNYVFTQRGVYNIGYKGKDQVGCEYERYKDFYVSKPQASFTYNLLGNCLPVDINLINTSVFDTLAAKNYYLMGGGDTLFLMENGDSLYTIDTSYRYTTAGNKSITLYTENIFGCSDTVVLPNLLNLQPFEVRLRTTSRNNICAGSTILFRNVSSDLSNNTFIWDFGDGDSLISQDDTISHTFNIAGTFNVKLRGEDANGCVRFDSVLFRVEENPVAGFTADTTISSCYPLEVQFQDTSSGNIVKWFWQIGPNFSVLENPRFVFDEVGKFDVSLRVETANGCVDSVFKSQYIQTNGPEASFSIDKNSACVNEVFTFSLDSQRNVSSYVWDFGDGNTQTGGATATHAYRTIGKVYVSLILSDASGTCNVPILDSVIISDVLADFTMQSDTGCAPYTSNFVNASINANSLSWNFGKGQGFSSSQNQESVVYETPGRYFIQLAITSSIGCIDTAVKMLDVFESPNALVSGDTGLCIGQSVQLNASGGTFYMWSPDTFITDINISNPIVNPKTNTRYTVRVSDPSTCFDTASILVEVIQQPIPFILLDSTLIIGENYQLNANAGRGFNYQWTPPDGLDCPTCPNPLATPLQNTTYYLVVSDDFGCFTVRDTIEIKVEEKYSLDVPTAFSPNNDGINDIIYAKGWGLKELLSFKIYNRFGELVFESTDFDHGWNGMYKGKEQNIETYIYTVEALTFGDKVLTKTGNISLLR